MQVLTTEETTAIGESIAMLKAAIKRLEHDSWEGSLTDHQRTSYGRLLATLAEADDALFDILNIASAYLSCNASEIHLRDYFRQASDEAIDKLESAVKDVS